MKCPNCHEEIPEHVHDCVVCGTDVGYPNVRAALHKEEVSALKLRVKETEEDASLRGFKSVLDKFRDSVAQSVVVISCSLGKINELLSGDNQLYTTFYKAIGGESRLPEDNEWDKIRMAVDSLIFPYYAEHIRFGSLSIDLTGISGYGVYCMVLKETAIKDRATVFEENSIMFIKKHRIVPGDTLPQGYRATWMDRSSLAVAKLGKRLTPTTTETEFPKLLASSDTTDPDFIEVHIYGPIHRRAIKYLSGPEPRQKADKVLIKSISRKLTEIGATMEISK
ncbi:MAG: hypothetical protein A2Y66_09060 [Nitrospirae bacterium RBG_13_41_22]|nr:MAG: hypothetical protein A2Y66_09060 [Nitrospirae bacterium RBG_13_41_22]